MSSTPLTPSLLESSSVRKLDETPFERQSSVLDIDDRPYARLVSYFEHVASHVSPSCSMSTTKTTSCPRPPPRSYYPKLECRNYTNRHHPCDSEMEALDKCFTQLADKRREALTKYISAEEVAYRKLQRALPDANIDDEEKHTRSDVDSANVILDVPPWAQGFAE